MVIEMDKKEWKRMEKNFKKVEDKFDLIDEQVDRGLTVSKKTLDIMIDIWKGEDNNGLEDDVENEGG